MITSLHHIAILCSDKQKALTFYVDALGFKLKNSYPRPLRGDEILMLEGYGVVIELFVVKDRPARVTSPEAYGLRHLALKVSDIERLSVMLRARGFEPEPIRNDSFTYEKMTFVKDPDGLPIELHE
jgi:glyoxylase I family protein